MHKVIEIEVLYKNLNCPAKQSRGWRFSGYSFTIVCIELTGRDTGLYEVFETKELVERGEKGAGGGFRE
jgi:hypothetical protein